MYDLLGKVTKKVGSAIDFIAFDYYVDSRRFVLEMIGMIASILASVVLAITVPEPNIGLCYLLWMVGSSCLIITSLSRGSTGFTIIYGTFLVIDSIGMARWILYS
jgi:hypothetical protein